MGKIKLNVSKFFDELEIEQEDMLKREYSQFIRKLVELLLTSAVSFTPVRTGRLRGGWQISVGRANLTPSDILDAEGSRTIRRGMAVLGSRFDPYTTRIHLTNSVKYASFVNYGTDRMAPRLMLERAQTEVERFVR